MHVDIDHSIERPGLSRGAARDQPGANQHRNLRAHQTVTSQPFSYVRPHSFMASASPITCPVLLSSLSSRFTRHATFESCSMVTLTFATSIGECSFSPVRIPAMKLAK